MAWWGKHDDILLYALVCVCSVCVCVVQDGSSVNSDTSHSGILCTNIGCSALIPVGAGVCVCVRGGQDLPK